MTIRRAAALIALLGACLLTAGAALAFGLAGGLIAAGMLLCAAGASNL